MAGQGGVLAEGGTGGRGGGPSCTATGAETCASNLDEDCDGSECGLWGHVYGSSSMQFPLGIEVAPNGDTYFLFAFNNAGDSIQFAGSTITATGEDDYVLAKVSVTGQEVWANRFTAPYGYFQILGANEDGVFIGGNLFATIDLGGGPLVNNTGVTHKAFAAFDSDGDFLWNTAVRGPTGALFLDAAGLSPLGQIVIAGHAWPGAEYEGEVIADPNAVGGGVQVGFAIDAITGVLLWHHEWETEDLNYDLLTAIGFDAQGEIFLGGGDTAYSISFGGPTLVPGPQEQGFLVHLDTNGEWVAGAFICDYCQPEKIAVGPAGEVIVSGWGVWSVASATPLPIVTTGTAISRLDAVSFEPVWTTFTSDLADFDIDANGEIRFSFCGPGAFYDDVSTPAIGVEDLLLGKMDMSGAVLWHRKFGAPGATLIDREYNTYRSMPDGHGVLLFRGGGAPVDFGAGAMTFSGSNLGLVQIAP